MCAGHVANTEKRRSALKTVILKLVWTVRNHLRRPYGLNKRVSIRGLRSSGMLRSVDWWLFTDVSGQPMGPIFNGQAVCLTVEDGTDMLSRNVSK
jgi:hypothetical protein